MVIGVVVGVATVFALTRKFIWDTFPYKAKYLYLFFGGPQNLGGGALRNKYMYLTYCGLIIGIRYNTD